MDSKADIRLTPLFDLVAELAPTNLLGHGPRGERRMVPILSGSFEGSRLRGTILPGGVDWQIVRPDGVTEIEAHYSLQTDDGVVIRVINKGYRHGPPDVMRRISEGETVASFKYYFRAAPIFDTPLGRYEWLSRSLFISTGERSANSVLLRFYEVM
jgi:Protein of unknown function (DUF3237)